MNRFEKAWSRLTRAYRRLTRAYVCDPCGLRCKSTNGLSRHQNKCKVFQAVPRAAQAIRG